MKRFLTVALCVLIGSPVEAAVRSGLSRQGRVGQRASLRAKIAEDLRNRPAAEMVDVIVQFTKSASSPRLEMMRGRLSQRILMRGGKRKARLDLIKGDAYSVRASQLEDLAAEPDVAYIAADRQVKASLDYSAAATGADQAWSYGRDGTGVGVAVIDSGITKHDDTNKPTKRVIHRESFVGGGDDDHYGHGTHVAGIIAGSAYRSTGENYFHRFLGIAPNANLISLRVLDDDGIGFDSDVIAAIQRAIELKNQYNIRVINLSLGRPVYESYTNDPLCQAVESAWNAGIVVVVAAGNLGRNNSFENDGYGTITSPGNDPYVITVGAMKARGTFSNTDDEVASYSSKGPTLVDHIVKPDIVAPGNQVVSLLAGTAELDDDYPQTKVPLTFYEATGSGALSNKYFKLSGTSMATPVVSGAVALMLQQDPTLTPDQVKARLMKTASKAFPSYSTATHPVTGEVFTSQYDIFTIGAGYLNVMAALNNSDMASGNTLSPSVTFDELTGLVRLVHGDSVVWGTSMVWGTGVVWGTSVVWGTTVIPGTNIEINSSSLVWGTGVVWGTGLPAATSVVWGTDSPWGSSLVWGTNHQVEAMTVLTDGEQ